MAYLKSKHDIGITNTGGTIVGMMLVQKNDTPQYQVFDDEYLTSQFFTGVPGYGSLPAEKELAIRQDSWRHGISDNIYDASRPEAYYRSKGMDLRHHGMAIASWQVNTIAVNTTGLLASGFISNPDFEINTNGWATSGTVERDTQDKFSGVASLRIDRPTAGDAGARFNYPWNTQYQSQEFVATVKANCSASPARFKLGIHDGVSNTWSANYTASTWGDVSVTKTLAAAANMLRVMFHLSTTTDTQNTWVDDLEIVPTNGFTGYPRKFADYANDLFMVHGSVLSNIAANGGAWEPVKRNLPGHITSLEPFPDGLLYLCCNYFAPYYEMNESRQFTRSNLYPYFQFFKTIHSGSPTMWGNDAAYQIRSTVAPKAGGTAWSGVTNVGSSYYDITDLTPFESLLYIMKENQPYYLDSTGAVQEDLAPELEALLRSTSGKNPFAWKGKLYIPCGEQGLLETDGTTNEFIQPATYSRNIADYTGRVMAVAGDEEYLFVAIKNGDAEVELLAGRRETIDNTTQWVWHPIAEITTDDVETMHISTKVQKRLYIATVNSSKPIYYIPLPTGYGNIIEDDNRLFLSNTFFETPFLHANFKDTKKAFPQLDLVMGHSYDADVFFQAHYKTLSNSTYTFIANYKGSATSMKQTNFLPDAGSNHPVDEMIRLKFTANTNNTSLTPILYSYHLKGLLYPSQREIIACVIRCADELLLKDGSKDTARSTEIAATLDEARKATWPVSIRDINGDTLTVKFLPLPASVPRWAVVKDEKNRKMEKYYNVLMQKVSLS